MTATNRVDAAKQKKQRPADAGVDSIRAAILQGEFAPGQRLIEAELTERLQIGRGPVREALRRLAVEGLVAIEPNRGAVVARADRDTILGTFELREQLEGLAARRAAEQVDVNGYRRELELALAVEQNAGDRDLQTFLQTNENLHSLIIRASGNKVLPRILSQLQLPELRSVFFQRQTLTSLAQSTADHILILESILAGRAKKAEQAMRTHLERAAKSGTTLPGVAGKS